MELLYIGFVLFILLLLALDLGVFHRKAHVVSMREALGWSALWISVGLTFTVFVYFGYEHHWLGLGTSPDATSVAPTTAGGVTYYNDGGSAAIKYLTGFVVEKSLAVDNIFVIAMIFGFLHVPAMYQHRVLFWGIVGALQGVARGALQLLRARARRHDHHRRRRGIPARHAAFPGLRTAGVPAAARLRAQQAPRRIRIPRSVVRLPFGPRAASVRFFMSDGLVVNAYDIPRRCNMIRYENDERQKRVVVLGSFAMSMVSVALVLLTIFAWYPRTVS